MNLKKARQGLLLTILVVAVAGTAAAQGSITATGKANRGLDWNEAFEGSTDSSG
jgi:hypothetical protein